jgi:S1-C subfamily serine protease
MRIASQVAAMIMVTVGTGCGSNELASNYEFLAPPPDPAHRAVHIETAGCGFAPDRTGSGVAVGDGLVLTVAHLVARADGISATVGDGVGVDAVVTAVDLNLDLALLQLPPNEVPFIEMSSAGTGAEGFIVGAAASGTVPFEIKEVVSLSIEEILGTDRHSRLGYELEASTRVGDSGAGAYDGENRLIGIVFATGEEGESSWITSSAEIEGFLAAHGSDKAAIVCDPGDSRLDLP